MGIIDLLELLFCCNVKKCCVILHHVDSGHVHKFTDDTSVVLNVFNDCLVGSCIVVSYSLDKDKSFAKIECIK